MTIINASADDGCARHALVADEEAKNQKPFQNLLESHLYDLSEACDGEDALKQVASQGSDQNGGMLLICLGNCLPS